MINSSAKEIAERHITACNHRSTGYLKQARINLSFEIDRAIRQAVAEEREACAVLVDQVCGRAGALSASLLLVAAIRSRANE